MFRLLAIGALFAVSLSAFVSVARADDATPIAPAIEESATPEETPEAVYLSVGFYYCNGSSTPGVTDWLAFSDFENAATSTCELTYGGLIDPAQTVGVYDAETDELLQTFTFNSGVSQNTEALAGSFYFVESLNGSTSPVYTLEWGQFFEINALAHIGTGETPTPAGSPVLIRYGIRSTVCEPADSSESGKLLVVPQRSLFNVVSEDVSTAAESPAAGCNYDAQPADISSIGSFYLESAGVTTAAEGSYGPYTATDVDFDDLPSGDYVIRLVRNSGVVQISEPFYVSGSEDTRLELYIYTGEEPTATATATVTETATTTATATATSPAPTSTATSVVTTLPSTGSGSSDSNSWLLVLGGVMMLGVGIAARMMRSPIRKH